MTEMRFDFATDDALAGFRLDNFELYNWGTYNKRIVEFRLEKQNGLLTGDIGSGKSTIVDALTTLIVPHQKITYNKAAGAESKERSLNSYVLGEYKSSKDEGFSSAKAVTLRDETSFSVLCANFKNDGYDEVVGLAQFFHIKNGQLHKFFVVSKTSISIKNNLFHFKDVRELKKRLRETPHIAVYDTFKEYSKDFRRAMGIKNEQALNLFYQTVSLKSIGNLTEFIRSHMLERTDMEGKIDALCANFSELNHMHNLVLRAKREIELLSPIAKEGKKYDANFVKQEEYKRYKNSLNAYIASFKISLLTAKIDELQIELQKTKSKKSQADATQEELYRTLSELNLELKQNGGDRLSSIDKEIQFVEKSLQERKKQNGIYNDLAKKLEFPTVSNEHRFLHNFQELQKRFDGIDAKIDKLQNDKAFELASKNRYEQSVRELETEVLYLQNNRSNIPQKLSQVRDVIASSIGVEEASLPFVGELIEVQDANWNGAIERVLNSFAMCLLVESEQYEAVSNFVETTHLGAKLVYLKIDTKKQEKQFVEILPNSLLNKIEIKADSPYFNQLNIMLKERFNIPCVKDMADFRRFKKALSINGQFKTNFSRHEKDDRFDINDSRRWILGWDNALKLEQTKEDLEEELQKIALLDKNIRKFEQDIKILSHSRDDLRDILKFESFSSIDWYSFSKKIEQLKGEREELQKSSDIIKTLQESIVKKDVKIKEQKELIDALSKRAGQLETIIETRKEELSFAELTVKNADDLESVQDKISQLLQNEEQLNLNNISTYERNLRGVIDKELDSLRAKLERSFKRILHDMNAYKGEFQAESKDFDAEIESLEEFINKLNELKKDNLPKWEKKFHALFREKTIQNIVIVQSELEHQSDEIKSKIDKINSSLKDIEYNDGSYITLEIQKSISQEIREFRESLKNAIEGSMEGDDGFNEAKFLQIKKIIERLNGREGQSEVDKRWRKLVTDVRNWFDFSAMERYISDDSDKEYYPHSGGKSGGQKEKLAYTVLASSLAFQFGLEYDKIQSRSFRFVMIDEAFGRGSDESTRYALRLFEKLHLQLLVITPKQKINVIEPFVKSVHFVHNRDGMDSSLLSMSIEEFVKNKKV